MQYFAALLAILLVGVATCPAAPFRFVEDADLGTLTIFDGSDPVLTYNFGEQLKPGVDEKYRRSCYIHPLYGSKGEILTEDFIDDHLHHRGVSWMWPRMKARGKDVQTWHPSELRQVFVRWIIRESDENSATLAVENAWKLGDGKGETVAREEVRIRVHRAAESGRAIDLNLSFDAVGGPVELLGAEGKGYGGLNLRFASVDGRVLQTDRDPSPQNSDRERYEWVDLSAKFGKDGAVSGATVFAHPKHPDFPPGWTLRTDYAGVINAAWPGLKPYTLQPGSPLHLGYRIQTHDGAAQADVIRQSNAAYAKSTVEEPAPSAEELELIRNAIPDRPSVEPKRPRQLLVFSRAWGYKHTAISYGKAAIQAMADKSGAFAVTLSSDPAMFEPEILKRFDAVVLNNTNNEIFLPENMESLSVEEQARALVADGRLKRSFVDFLKQGKGLVVIHAGLASFREWPEFGTIIGARFDNHPWNSGSTVTLKIEDPKHPLMGAFPDSSFVLSDEIYQFKTPYSRENLRVLLSLDTGKTKLNRGRLAIRRTDDDFALAWIKNYGEGRVFYGAIGHQHEIFWNPLMMRFYLDGIQFALGDLEAETEPVPQK